MIGPNVANIKLNDIIDIIVVGSRFELYDNYISIIAELEDDDLPRCGSCQYGKQTRTPTGACRTKREKIEALKQEKLEPGDCVAVDQFVVEIFVQHPIFVWLRSLSSLKNCEQILKRHSNENLEKISFFAIFNNEVKVLSWEGKSPVSGQSGL